MTRESDQAIAQIAQALSEEEQFLLVRQFRRMFPQYPKGSAADCLTFAFRDLLTLGRTAIAWTDFGKRLVVVDGYDPGLVWAALDAAALIFGRVPDRNDVLTYLTNVMLNQIPSPKESNSL